MACSSGVLYRLEEKNYCDKHLNSVEPLKIWTPTIAPSNMEHYNYDLIPEWKNSLLVGTLTASGRGNDIRLLKLSEDSLKIKKEMILFDGKYLRIRDLCISRAGEIYFSTSNIILASGSLGNDDKIFKISKYEKEEPLLINSKIDQNLVLVNPFGNELELLINKNDVEEIKVFSMNGKLVFQQTKMNDSKINTALWPSGLYLLQLRSKDGSEHVQKVIKN